RTAMIVYRVQQIGFCPAGEVEEIHLRAADGRGVCTPQHAGDAGAQEIAQADRVAIDHARRSRDDDRIAEAVSALVDPKRYLASGDVEHVGAAVTVDVTDQNALRIVTPREARGAAHGDAAAEAAVPEVWPIVEVAVADEDDILQAIAHHVGDFDARIGEA